MLFTKHSTETYVDVEDENYNDKKRSHVVGKIDVMGAVSHTGDRLSLSVREKALFAAAVV